MTLNAFLVIRLHNTTLPFTLSYYTVCLAELQALDIFCRKLYILNYNVNRLHVVAVIIVVVVLHNFTFIHIAYCICIFIAPTLLFS